MKLKPHLYETHNSYEVPLHEPIDFSKNAPIWLDIKTARIAARTVSFIAEEYWEIMEKLGQLDAHWDSQTWYFEEKGKVSAHVGRLWKASVRVFELYSVPEGYEEQAAEAFARLLDRNPYDAIYMIPRELLDTKTWCRHYRCLRLIRHYLRNMHEDVRGFYTLDRFPLEAT